MIELTGENLEESSYGIIDGHVHLHYPSRDIELSQEIARDMGRESIYKEDPRIDIEGMKEILKRKGVEKVFGIFLERDLDYIDPFLNDEFIAPGLYLLSGEYDMETLEEQRENFQFAKVYPNIYAPFFEEVKEVVDDCVDTGYDKIQIHTESITPDLLDLVEDYAGGNDINFYLVHGIDAFNSYLSDEVSSSDLKKLEDNLFLGTSPSSQIIMGPIQNVQEEGLEDLVVFESDATLFDFHNGLGIFNANLERADVIPDSRKKILNDNAERFIQ